jgi:hypothetical protein
MEDQVHAVGDQVNITYYNERKKGSKANSVVKIISLLPDGFLEVKYDSRHGEIQKIHKDDILVKTTRK